jgi:hypothetical protein
MSILAKSIPAMIGAFMFDTMNVIAQKVYNGGRVLNEGKE